MPAKHSHPSKHKKKAHAKHGVMHKLHKLAVKHAKAGTHKTAKAKLAHLKVLHQHMIKPHTKITHDKASKDRVYS